MCISHTHMYVTQASSVSYTCTVIVTVASRGTPVGTVKMMVLDSFVAEGTRWKGAVIYAT